MRKSRKARTDPYLALLEYRKTPSQELGTSPVQRLMSRRTRAQLPIIPKLLRPVVQPKIYQKLLAKKERQVFAYNRGVKDLGALRSGDTVRLVPPGNPSKEAVKAKVERCVGTRSFEVATEDGARYRRNRRHLRKKKEACRSSDLLSWLKKALSNRINSGHPYLKKHRLVMSSPRRVSGQPYPVVEWIRPMGVRWHLGNRSHLLSLVGYLCEAQRRDQSELLRSQLIKGIMLLGCKLSTFHKL